jgi:hypothetical protein
VLARAAGSANGAGSGLRNALPEAAKFRRAGQVFVPDSIVSNFNFTEPAWRLLQHTNSGAKCRHRRRSERSQKLPSTTPKTNHHFVTAITPGILF